MAEVGDGSAMTAEVMVGKSSAWGDTCIQVKHFNPTKQTYKGMALIFGLKNFQEQTVALLFCHRAAEICLGGFSYCFHKRLNFFP